MSKPDESLNATNLRAALFTLQALNVPFRGPFATPRGLQIYVVDGRILTEEEIVKLYASGKFTAGHIEALRKNSRQNQRTDSLGGQMTENNFQNRRRSQRVLMQIGVLLRAELPGGDVHQVQAFTQVVNAHGGLLEAPLNLTASQKITLANLRTGEAADCRVVQVEGPSDSNYTIAFEFEGRNPRFWPIPSPPDDWFESKDV